MIRHRIAPFLARGSRIEDMPNDYARNRGTRFDGETGAFARSALSGWLALARYEAALRRAVEVEPADRVFVAAVDSDGQPACTAVLEPGDAIVFGRHTRAGLRNESVDLSLRHVAVAVAPCSTAAAPLVRLWDLATGRPFTVEGGHVCEAVTADGPVFACVGAVHIAVVPLSRLPNPLPVGTRALWDALPRREHIVARVAEGTVTRPPVAPGDVVEDARGELEDPMDDEPVSRRQTRVTRLPAAAPLDYPEHLDDELDGPAVAQVELVTATQRCRYRVSLEQLDRGVLVGRYDRCSGPSVLPNNVSRVHLLIARLGDSVVAIDTASTKGTFIGESNRAFVTATLEQKQTLRLADCLLLRWQARASIHA